MSSVIAGSVSNVNVSTRPGKNSIIRAYARAVAGEVNEFCIPSMRDLLGVEYRPIIFEGECLPALLCERRRLRKVPLSAFESSVAQMVQKHVLTMNSDYFRPAWFECSPREIKQIAEMFCYLRKDEIESTEIAPVAFYSNPTWCWHRLNIDAKPCDNLNGSEAWSDVAARMYNFDAFAHWVYDLFNLESDRSQYVWIFGQGGSGKDTICSALFHLLEGSAVQTSTDAAEERFWSHCLLGTRLCYFGEAKANFVMKPFFKSLTGSPRIHMESKGKNPVNICNHAKFIFASNWEPEVSSKTEHTRRLIFCSLQPYSGEKIVGYEKKLISEIKALLDYGAFLAGKNNLIIPDVEQTALITEQHDERYTSVFERFFEPGLPGDYVSMAVIREKLGVNLGVGRLPMSDLFNDWIERYKLKRDKVRCQRTGLRLWVLRGMKCK